MLALITLDATAAQKPTVVGQLFTDYRPAPSTLAGLVNVSDAVVKATVTSSQNIVLTDKGYTYPMADYTVSLNEIVKGSEDLKQGSILIVRRSGGDVDLGDKIRRSVEPAFSPFQVGDQCVLFLHWNAYFPIRSADRARRSISHC